MKGTNDKIFNFILNFWKIKRTIGLSLSKTLQTDTARKI